MSDVADYSHGEPPPIPNEGKSMHDKLIEYFDSHYVDPDKTLLVEAIKARKELGLAKYQTVLQANNGRDWLNDLIDELGDALAYVQQGRVETLAEGSDVDLRHGCYYLLNEVRHVFVKAVKLREANSIREQGLA